MVLHIENIKVCVKSTQKMKIFDANFFPDKFGPVSGFVPDWSILVIFFNPAFR